MESVSKTLYNLIAELQSLDFLNRFSLAGGTSLAIRFNHRKSIDIDLFSDSKIGLKGFNFIKVQLHEYFKSDLIFCKIENSESGDQFCFLKVLIRSEGENIKVEFLQNFQHLDKIEVQEGIKVFSIKDIGLFKLMSASNRRAKKDIYDLDYITDEIPLSNLIVELKDKLEKYNTHEFKNLFDLDNEKNPVDDLNLLLEFDKTNKLELPSRPSHSNDIIEITANSKTWIAARTSWRRKVRDLMKAKGIPLPPLGPIN